MTDFQDLKQRLNLDPEAVCHYLLPNGKAKSGEWCVGNIQGDPGDSLKIRLSGSKIGQWKDFGGVDDEKGDLITLWQKVRGLNKRDTVKEIKEYLGIRDPEFYPMKRKTYSLPQKPKCAAPKSDVLKFWTEELKLTPETLAAYKVAETGRTAVYPYLKDGKLIMWKKKGIDRDEHGKRRPILASSGTEPILFGWQTIEKYFPDTNTLYLTEGEEDAMTLFQYGYPALSLPFGGGSGDKHQWVISEFETLELYEDIVLCLDDDEQGHAAVVEIVKRIGAHRCKVAYFKPYKDANDALKAGMTKVEVDKILSNASEIKMSELKSASEYYDEVYDFFYPSSDADKGFPLPWKKVGNDLLFRPDEVSLISGINGHGKTSIINQFVANMMHLGVKVCVASMEMKPKRLLGLLTKQVTAMADPSPNYIQEVIDWYSDRLWIYDVLGEATHQNLLEAFQYARRRYGVTFFVIDSLVKLDIADDDYNAQKNFVNKLKGFANQYDCHVMLVAHPRKIKSEFETPGKLDISGSGNLTNLVDTCLICWRNKNKELALQTAEDERSEFEKKCIKGPDAVLYCVKQRNGDGWEGKITLTFHNASKQFLESSIAQPIRYVPFTGIKAVPKYLESNDTPESWEEF